MQSANEALSVSEERFRMIADSCPSMMWATNAESIFYFTNKACRQFLRDDARRVGKRQAADADTPRRFVKVMVAFNRAIGDHTTFRMEARYGEPMASGGSWECSPNRCSRRAAGTWATSASVPTSRIGFGPSKNANSNSR